MGNFIHHGEKNGVGITPMGFIKSIEERFGKHFTIDACASKGHQRCKRFITPEEDFIKTDHDFDGEVVWMNPPYIKTKDGRGYTTATFIDRAMEIHSNHHCAFAILLESNMTGTKYFQRNFGSTHGWVDRGIRIYFPPGRIEFEGINGGGNTKSSMVILIDGADDYW